MWRAAQLSGVLPYASGGRYIRPGNEAGSHLLDGRGLEELQRVPVVAADRGAVLRILRCDVDGRREDRGGNEKVRTHGTSLAACARLIVAALAPRSQEG